MLQVIPIINNKGGVGKTTTAVNLAGGLALQGRRVLLVDLDSQGSASLALGLSRDDLRPSSADVIYGSVDIEQAIRRPAGASFDLITGSLELADFDVRVSRLKHRAHRLRNVLAEVRSAYDVILLDCAPSTSLLSINALVAADAFIIPLHPSYLAVEGMMSLAEVVRRIRFMLGRAAPMLGIALTMVDRSREETVDIVAEVREHYGAKVFRTEIRPDPDLIASPGAGQTIFDYAPTSQAAQDYLDLTTEVIERIERHASAPAVKAAS